MNLLTAFLTGLFTGGLSCLAVQGGLLAANIVQNDLPEKSDRSGKNKDVRANIVPILSFLIAKLIVYTLLGVFLGLIGSAFQFSVATRVFFQIAVVIFMTGSALNILQVHPVFRYFAIQPPGFLVRRLRILSRSQNIFTPAILGAFTIFIPCGTTQAIMVAAVGSGSPAQAGLIMFAFILGTLPVFFVLGLLATSISKSLQQKFMKIVALGILILAIYNANTALVLAGVPGLRKLGEKAICSLTFCQNTDRPDQAAEATSDATISIGPGGYSPRVITVNRNSTVTIHLKNIGGGGCAAAFTIPTLGIQKTVPVGAEETVTFVAPDRATEILFTCSMGMYTGTIRVI